MKHFLSLIEHLRGSTILRIEANNRPVFEYEPGEYDWNKIEQCQPFVFDMDSYPEDQKMSWGGEIDAPFPVFSIETLGGKPLVELLDPIESLTETSLSEEDYRIIKESNRDGIIRYNINCVVVSEYKPKKYDVFMLMEAPNALTISKQRVMKAKIELIPQATALVTGALDLLRTGSVGTESVRIKMKTRSGSQKKYHKIRRIIHVGRKGQQYGRSEAHKNVDWSHRFEVRGHWRKTEKLGKNREGLYCVEGFTWVKNHERGPEHLPLIKKTRLVHSHV